jgi:hypothetical protein
MAVPTGWVALLAMRLNDFAININLAQLTASIRFALAKNRQIINQDTSTGSDSEAIFRDR